MKAIQRGDSLYLENVGGCDWIAAFRNAPQAHEVGNIINQHEALVQALKAARDALNDMAKDTSSSATAMQNKAVTAYMRARDALAAAGQ